MKEPRLIYLIKKILNKTSTDQEMMEVDNDLLNTYHHALLDSQDLADKDEMGKKIQQNVLKAIRESEHRNRLQKLTRRYLPYAAAILIISSIGFLFYINIISDHLDNPKQEHAVLKPAHDKAVLQNDKGKLVKLSGQKAGDTIQFGALLLKIEKEGVISYKKQDADVTGPPKLVTLKTPKGGKFQINLEDGTKVWLNTESSIVFPEHFDRDRRLVSIQGEAYFEVAESRSKPFIVQGDNFGVRVLGTKFNVSSRTTNKFSKVALLQGSVQLTSKVGNKILKPGERATMDASRVIYDKFDPETELAWKDNYFIFKDENIKSVMDELAQWYDAEIIFQGNEWNDVNFNIRISRRENIEEILSIMEFTKSVQFKIEGRRIYVIKK
ncbi:FecR family protein [Sphingobacterium sp. HSC-15S19]|uniref:FecR family protein n=1 Tax=Sphingobacterium sp. HSC-15S19 TaxID=2910971 RepID=UPI003D1E1146